MKNRTWIIIYLLFISGCGFQLRGSGGFQFDNLYVDAVAANNTAAEIKRIIEEEGIKLSDTPKQADIVVSLRNETVNRRVLSISAISGKLEEVELNLQVELTISHPNGKKIQEPQKVSLIREYSFDETAVLAISSEEDTLIAEMFREIVAQIIRRLQAVKIENK